MSNPVLRFISIAGLAAALVIVGYEQAFAYIDPATGSYFLQMLLAGLLGAAFAVKMFWRQIKAFFSRLFSRSHTPDGDV